MTEARHPREHGVLDVLAMPASILYAGATAFLCLVGRHALTPDHFNETQDAWGIVTIANSALQIAPVLLTPSSYHHAIIGKFEKYSSLATIIVVGLLLVIHVLFNGFTMPTRWVFMIWLNALGAGIIDSMALWRALHDAKSH